ncbi:MAG: hypothetical protein PQJ60_10800 [Spirochaetales bacterium]|nr:hypothetical protein [Spirochaetales bacterium]
MRKVSYFETDEEHQKGFHYTLTVESKDLPEGYEIEGRLFGESVETIFCEPIQTNDETGGIFDMMRTLYWKIKEIPELDPLHRRMHTLAWADYDSERDEDEVKLPASFYQLGMILAEEKAEREKVADSLLVELDGLRRGMVASWIEELSQWPVLEEPQFSETNCWESGSVVIDGILHRVKDRFVVCDPMLNRRAWNITEREDVCPKCFPPDLKPTEVDPFFVPSAGPQMDLFAMEA